MIQDGIEYPIDAKGGLYHMRHHLLSPHLLLHALKGNQTSVDIYRLPINIYLNLLTGQLLWCQSAKGFSNRFGLRLEHRPQSLEIRLDHGLLPLLRLAIVHKDREVHLADCCMGFEVIVGPVCHPHQLYPAQTVQKDLRIPAVSSIMGHLIGLVLSEAELLRVYAHRQEVLIGPGHIIGQGLVSDNSPLHRFAKAHLLLHPLLLRLLGVELHPDCLDLIESGMGLVSWVDEDLCLGLGELPQSDHTLAGGDLISIGLANLHCREWKSPPEVAQEPGEVDEHPLGSLRPHVAGHLVSRADHGLEHEIELIDTGELAAALRTGDLILLHAAIDLLIRQGIGNLYDMLYQVIRPVYLLAFLASGEGIRKAAQMA